MNKLLRSIAGAILCGTVILGSLPLVSPARAAPPTLPQHPQQPHVFAPNCAARPRCVENICLRMGRCSLGSHTQPMGCLFYACKHGAR